MEILVGLLLGWPAILACVVIAIMGLFRKDARYLYVSGVIAIPFTWFLSGFPQMQSIVFLSPLLLFISAWAMSHKWEMVAWLFAVPFFLLILLLAGVALR
jgi:hypothetical protein